MNQADIISDSSAIRLHDDLAQAAERIIRGELPIPVRSRWKPLRMGLMNLFLFEDERFPFADGGLLLRGSNGAGKSRVLAMTLPLLLDGSFRANRVEPDRDPNRQVAWNLLMDDQNSRTGYSWSEFGRSVEASAAEGNGSPGEHQYLTIGCGMKAVRGQPIKPWFFITELRVDETLDLKTPDGVPLTQRQLAETLADQGQVFDRAADYRRQIDERLFRLGERYDPLIDLLLQLRQPQLAKKLDLDQLELALRGALPPLPEALLDDAAESFRDLDQYREGLATDRQTLDDVKKFLRSYRDHVRRGTLRAAKRLTGANSEYERAQRQQRQATEQVQAKQEALELETDRERKLRIRRADAIASLEALQSRPEMRDAARLDQLRDSVRRQRAELAEIAQDVGRAADELHAARKQAERTAKELEHHRAAAETASKSAADSAAPDALVNRHRERTKPIFLADLAASGQISAVQSTLDAEIRRWRKSAEHLAVRNKAVQDAQGKLRDAKRDTSNAKDQQDRVAEELAATESRLEEQRERLWEAIIRCFQVDSPLEPHLPPLGPFSDDWHNWAETPSDEDPLDGILAEAERRAEQQLAGEESVLARQLEELALRYEQLAVEQERLESGVAVEPPVPHTRVDVDREQRTSGAPFWQLVDFVKDVPESERGNWEAALEASGLLDAWLDVDGKLLDADRQDTQLVIGDEPRLAADRQLRRVIRVADSCDKFGMPVETVEALLAVIGVGEGAGRFWVDRDGRWQNGPLHGRWSKRQPQYIGEDARARWRTTRLAEIAGEQVAIRDARSGAEARSREIQGLRNQAAEHRQRAPSSTILVQRHTEMVAKQMEFDQASQRHRENERLEQERRDQLAQSTRQRDQDAADVGLTAWVERLGELETRLTQYEASLQVLWAKLESLVGTQQRSEEAAQRMRDVCARHEMLQQRQENKKLDVTGEEAKLRELEAASGTAVAEIIKRLETQRAAKDTLEEQIEAAAKQIHDVDKAIAVLESKLDQFDEISERCDEERREAAQWFGTIGSYGLIRLAVDEVEAAEQPWSMTQAIKLARACDTRLATVRIDDDAWQRSQNRVHQEHNSLQQTILSREGMGTDVDHLRDGLQLVTISMQGDCVSLAGAATRLETDVTERERILDEKEQETLERYLLGEVADGLRRRMQQAAELIELMTREVSQRPMKTGMQMRFKWLRDPEGPPGLAEACDVLRTVSATWSPAEREQIKQFLQRRIRDQRDSDAVGSWHDHLRDALDYRTWYRIEISRRSGPDADWRKLTRRTYGSGSGGEKAIALTLPQLAAAAAYYHTADPDAPRFILLDEAFAGISPDVRESCMELITAFDLDVVMTSENEWGCYAGVPQLAICQLDRFADINAVVNRLFVWSGGKRREATDPELAAEAERQPLFPD